MDVRDDEGLPNTHHSGVGKFVSHFGTTRMNARSAANAMFQGQGKQVSVDRNQIFGSDGKALDFYQFSFDHEKVVFAS